MTEAHLAAIEARANVAQRGPWRPDIDGPGMVYAGALNWQDTGGNADFIAHARTDIPALIAEVRRLRAALNVVLTDDRYVNQEHDDPSIKWVCWHCSRGTGLNTPKAIRHDRTLICGIAQAALAGDTPPSSTISER